MKPFLQELAEKLYKENPTIDELTLIVPNRRAALYFRKFLSTLLSKPVFAPSIITIEDFITSFSTLKVPEKLELIYRLFKTYQHVMRNAGDEESAIESFDKFFFWGEMLLKDFDEADKYMVNADHLFKDLSHQKELDSSFDYLTEEQKTFLKTFWNNFDETQTNNKRRFLYIWKKLPDVYHAFQKSLSDENKAYEGMLHRKVADEISRGMIGERNFQKLHFAGFNALTTAEEKILSYFVEHHSAQIHWDFDSYYVNNITQEAGQFFREYSEHKILKKTFQVDTPSNFLNKKEKGNIKLFGAAQPIGQAKLMAQILNEEFEAGNINPEETLIVLPDEKLLIPVLHGIPPSVEKLNVTMGYSLSSTPLFNLLELIIDLQINRQQDHFNHRQVLSILGHPYIVAADPAVANNKRKEILKYNWVNIPKGYLSTETDVHRLIFLEYEKHSLKSNLILAAIDYLKRIITQLGALQSISDFDKEYCLQFLKLLNKLENILNLEITGTESPDLTNVDKKERQAALKSFLRLFRQLSRSQKIPFSGEPLRGLQIMGVLETRNLDFKNVFILSLNEGSFPSISSRGSYIPFNIRKAYKLPTAEHQDAMYAYLFYRVLQRAENINLFYNSETDVLGQGEMSRYLQQLIYESTIPIEKKILDNPIEPLNINSIEVKKSKNVLLALAELNEGNHYFKGVSPSALNTYIECRLKFYLQYVAKVKEPKEVEEELDARVLGNFIHDVMEKFYKNINLKKGTPLIELNDYHNYQSTIDDLLDQTFIESYRLDPDKKVTYEGQRLVVREIAKRFIDRIIEMDKAYAPFYIEGLEQEGLIYTLNIDHSPNKAVISGKIDRVDRKDDIIRVIDYKTGKDKLNFESVESLFSRTSNRNKAAFQTLLYALLYKKVYLSDGKWHGAKLVPGLINRMNLFDDGFSFGLKVGNSNVTDVEPLLPEFEARLRELFNELYDPEKVFDQTQEIENCKHCAYTQICYR